MGCGALTSEAAAVAGASAPPRALRRMRPGRACPDFVPCGLATNKKPRWALRLPPLRHSMYALTGTCSLSCHSQNMDRVGCTCRWAKAGRARQPVVRCLRQSGELVSLLRHSREQASLQAHAERADPLRT